MVKKKDKLKETSANGSPRLSASLAGELPRFAQSAPPVVAVLGHVDHGKTTLLDSIRRTNIAQKEYGGITQRIGATSVKVISEGIERKITFIDTPGHEAFTRMRGRGIQAGDLALLVVSSVDGVMPQTKESIKLLQLTKTPFIVVLTKSDLPHKNLEKVKQQLLKEGVLLEGYGGDVPVIEVSAKTNTNIKELLDLILLAFELRKEKISVSQQLKGIVIESRLDPKTGARATIVLKNGSIAVRDKIEVEGIVARVRTIINDKGEHLKMATIGDAVEILGFEKVPPVGSVVIKKDALRLPRQFDDSSSSVSPQSQTLARANLSKTDSQNKLFKSSSHAEAPRAFAISATPSLPQSTKESTLSIVLCADTLGSLEAIINALPKEVLIVSQKTGEVTPADVLFAKSVGAIIIAFNIKIKSDILRLASQEKVLFKSYNIIYELIDEIKEVLEGKKLKVEEQILGKAKVLASFPYEKTKVLGIMVLEGRVARGDKVRLVRPSAIGEETIGESVIASIHVDKNPVSRIEKGHEGGALLSPFLDFALGDVLICHG